MGLDVLDFIAERGGNPEQVRESQRRRYEDPGVVDQVIQLWEDHRKTQYEATQLKAKANDIQKQVAAKKKAKEDAADLVAQKLALDKSYKETSELAVAKDAQLKALLNTVGNLVHDSVPVSDNEDNNPTLRTYVPEGFDLQNKAALSHHEVLLRIDGYNPEAGVKVNGHRGYFLTGIGVFLNQAIINYGLEFLSTKGYTAQQTPYMMDKAMMAATAQLSQFDEELYKVLDGETEKYLIATSEQPLSAFHAGEWLLQAELPKLYAGYSTNFRREAGSHGKDAWGTFRVHQFEKVEQFVLCDPEKSWEMFDNMIAYAEEFNKSLGLSYRIVEIVSGAFNKAAAKKYDLEAWFPYQQEYKELVSCSNCLDYQSRALEIRFGSKSQTDIKKKYVHALNSTLTATSRTMCAILETHQTEEGVKVPEVLRKYLPGAPDFIPFVKELPKEPTSLKKKEKAAKGKVTGAATGAATAVANTVAQAAEKVQNLTVSQ